MRHTTLIVPGFHGSGAAHWQTWFENELPHARRVGGIDWEAPVIAAWSDAIGREIDAAAGSVWLVAHSFGCLASVAAAAVKGRSDKIAGAFLVAPADPWRFAPNGLRESLPAPHTSATIEGALPQRPLDFPVVVVASENDPWVKFTTAAYWADVWGAHLLNAGHAGHINVDSGFGPWPKGLAVFENMQSTQEGFLLGTVGETVAACVYGVPQKGLKRSTQIVQDRQWQHALKNI